ncbi:MAG TPA: DNA-directed RNA polymerase subunit omega [Terriglobales bacterium]|jgi:DNA-directed RNA polymerase subunit omega|nr:DNA-directed RNA polymerase subunit omega [Terriglobales bacterium]
MEPKKDFDSKYRYILVAARRARQLQNGASALVETNSRKACRIAQDEIEAGKVAYVVPENTEVEQPVARQSTEE